VSGRPFAVDVSVVAPVYNELDNLAPLVDEIASVLRPVGRSFEILLVDDGSTDGSREKIAELSREVPEVRGIYLRRNSGQTAAFDAGFKHTSGRYVVTIDADLQNDAADIPKLVDQLGEHHAAVGYRAERRDDSALRRRHHRHGLFAEGLSRRLPGRSEAVHGDAPLSSHLVEDRGLHRHTATRQSPAAGGGGEQIRGMESRLPFVR
jgi:glycosyltransferase involved in cell wall biosynthesis